MIQQLSERIEKKKHQRFPERFCFDLKNYTLHTRYAENGQGEGTHTVLIFNTAPENTQAEGLNCRNELRA